MEKEIIKDAILTGERALFAKQGVHVEDCIFENGESPIKECADIDVVGSMFKWKYPFWYSENITVKDSTLFEMARAAIWYTRGISMEDTVIEAPKSFRRTNHIALKNVTFSNAAETLWHCKNISMENVYAKGDYFAMNSKKMGVKGLTLVGNYSFDGVSDVHIASSKLITKDAFWNSENVTAVDCFITGEYLGWNAKNLTLENCTIESLQGLCYIDNLVMRNCKLINTTLAFEYSTVDADIKGGITSVLNPSGGIIRADRIDELIIEKDKVDPAKTTIICRAQ